MISNGPSHALRGSKVLPAEDARLHSASPQFISDQREMSETPKNLVKAPLRITTSSACPLYDHKTDLRPRHSSKPTEKQMSILLKPTYPNDASLSTSCHSMIKAASVKPHRTNLPTIPTEVISMIADLLPASSVMSLSYSCTTIREKMKISITLVLGQKCVIARTSGRSIQTVHWKEKSVEERKACPLAHTMRNAQHTERLKLLCMLDRDRLILPSKAVCSGCADTHHRTVFSPSSLAESSAVRCCIGFAGRVWVCPHWTLDHNLKTAPTIPMRTDTCGANAFVAIINKRPCVYWPVAVLQENDIAPSQKLVEDSLGSLNVPICKHLQIRDPWVTRLYSPDCKKLRWSQDRKDPYSICRCSLCTSHYKTANVTPHLLNMYRHHTFDQFCQVVDDLDGGKCGSCSTKIVFRIVIQKDGADVLKLIVRREIKDFQGCTDPAWIEQVTDPADFEMLEREWSVATQQANQVLPSTGRIYE